MSDDRPADKELLDGFAWLDDSLGDSDCLCIPDFSRTGKTIDFGDDGVTGSLSDWHRLLQVTAPHPECGLVFARGNFPDNPGSILARAQHQGGRGSWGIKLAQGSDISIGGYRGEGLINHRWPYMAYDLTKTQSNQDNPNVLPDGDAELDSIGTLHSCYFVKDRTVFQAVFIRMLQDGGDLKFTCGGKIRFGCMCNSGKYTGRSLNDESSEAGTSGTQNEETTCSSKYPGGGFVLSTICNEPSCVLDMRLCVDGRDIKAKKHGQSKPINGCVDVSWETCTETMRGERELIIVAAFSLSSATTSDYTTLQPILSTKELESYLGLNGSKAATSRMWVDTFMSGRDPERERLEMDSIARCVERILGVSSVPLVTRTRRSSLAPSASSSLPGATELHQGKDGLALIPNIVTLKGVNLQSMFWQIRLLVKAHNFLVEHGSISKSHAFPTRIRSQLRNSLLWILETWDTHNNSGKQPLPSGKLIEPEHCDPDSRRAPEKSPTAYKAICIWYVMRHCKAVLAENTDLVSRIVEILQADLEIVPADLQDLKPKFGRNESLQLKLWKTLLQWCHFGSVCRIVENISDNRIQLEDRALGFIRQLERDWKEHGRGLIANYSRRVQPEQKLQVDPSQVYLAVDEEIHRLALLCQELELTTSSNPALPEPKEAVPDFATLCVTTTCEKVVSRKYTTRFNHGPGKDTDEENQLASVSAPWELSCLNHHALLSALLKRPEDVDGQIATKEDCFEFLQSDFTFARSWDRSRANMIGEWWGMEVSSVICATLLESKAAEKSRTKEDPDRLSSHTRPEPQSDASDGNIDLKVTTGRITGKLRSGQRPVDANVLRIFQTLKELQQHFSPDQSTKFEWKAFRPPGYAETYSPDFMLQSLDDTPERFTQRKIKAIKLKSELEGYFKSYFERYRKKYFNEKLKPGLGNYFKHALDKKELEWPKEKVDGWLQAEDTIFINVLDLSLDEGIAASTTISRSYDDCCNMNKGKAKDPMLEKLEKLCEKGGGDDRKAAFRRFWSFYLNGNPKDWPADDDDFDSKEYNSRICDPAEDADSKGIDAQNADTQDAKTKTVKMEIQSILKTIPNPQEWYKKKLLDHLNDSLVDQNVKYRILFAQRCSPRIFKVLSHLWHPEASKVFYDYITSRTAFSDSRVQSSELWTTSITISHWVLRPARFPQYLSDIFDEMREQGEIPPRKVQESAVGSANIFRRLRERVQASTANERALEAHASSIVITGDHLGTFWICSVLSTLIDEDSVSRLVDEVKELTGLFIHRQSTGRRLSFVVLVGRLCANMAGEYDRIRDCLEKAVGVSTRVLFDGVKLQKSTKTLLDLQRMVWGLESFRVLAGTLTSSLNDIQDVKVQLEHDVKEERDQWDKILLEKYEKVIEDFDKHVQELALVQAKIDRRVEQLNSLSNSISSITSVAQNLEGLEQNANIKILTFITIAYLPLGFVASLFALSDGVMPKNAGRPLFVGLIFILLVATFALAMAIPTVGKYWNEYFDSGEENQDTGEGDRSEYIDPREDDRGQAKEEGQVDKKNNGEKEKREKIKKTARRESRQKKKNTQTEKTPGMEIDLGQGAKVEEVKGKEKEGSDEEDKQSRKDEVKPEENEEVKQENGAPNVASTVQSEAASGESGKKARSRISAWFHPKRKSRFRSRIASDEEQGDGKSGTPN